MIDQYKRKTLKTISAAAAVATFPPALSAATTAMSGGNKAEVGMYADLAGTRLEIEIEPAMDPTVSWMRITNPTNEPMTLKHVLPGVVSSNNELFDINAVLVDGPLTIDPDNSYSFMVKPLTSQSNAIPGPAAQISPASVSVITQLDNMSVTTKRMMLI